MLNLEEKLKKLKKSIKEIEEIKVPPSKKCIEIMSDMIYYHENLLNKKEIENFKCHLKNCIWCFNFYIQSSISRTLAGTGTLEEAPQWIKDRGNKIFDNL